MDPNQELRLFCFKRQMETYEVFKLALANHAGRPLTVQQHAQASDAARKWFTSHEDPPDYVVTFLEKERAAQPMFI